MTQRYIQSSFSELKNLYIEKERIEKKIKDKERIFKDYMIENGVEEIRGPHNERIVYKKIDGKRFDSSGFKAAHAYLYDLYTIATSTFRFKFTY